MTRYVALLRGVNVGGKSMIDMKELKAVFEAAGMQAVRTYINSGNVIFSTDRDRAEVSTTLQQAIAERFDTEIGVLLRDIDEMRAVVDALPAHWVNDEHMKCDVLFLWPEVDRPEVLDGLPIKPDIEDVRYVPGAVIRRVDRKNVGRSGLVRVISMPTYKRMTVRNCNTPRKLLELMEE